MGGTSVSPIVGIFVPIEMQKVIFKQIFRFIIQERQDIFKCYIFENVLAVAEEMPHFETEKALQQRQLPGPVVTQMPDATWHHDATMS